jgi:hypothetical protein
VRFPNEIKAIKEQGGRIVWIQRGELPSWHIMAAKANAGDVVAQTKLTELGIHASETAWVGTDFDAIVDNNGSIESLYSQIRNLLQSPQASTANGIYKPLADSLSIPS